MKSGAGGPKHRWRQVGRVRCRNYLLNYSKGTGDTETQEQGTWTINADDLTKTELRTRLKYTESDFKLNTGE